MCYTKRFLNIVTGSNCPSRPVPGRLQKLQGAEEEYSWRPTAPPPNCPQVLVRSLQSHSRTFRWCPRGLRVQSGSRDCEAGSGWWNRPTGETDPRRSGSPRPRGARGRNRWCLRGRGRGRIPGGTLWEEVSPIIWIDDLLSMQMWTQSAGL